MKMKRKKMKTIGLVLMMAMMVATGVVSAGEDSPQIFHFTEYGPVSPPQGITRGPDDALWYTSYWNGVGKVGRITTAGVITEYSTPGIRDNSRIAAGPDGALWFTESTGIGRITTTGSYTEYPVCCNITDIAAGPDGALWFTETYYDQFGNCEIGRISTIGVINEYVLPMPYIYSLYLTRGPGRALWFTGFSGSGALIGSITAGGAISEIFIGYNGPIHIASGPDGNLWGTEAADHIWRVSTAGTSTVYTLPDRSYPTDIIRGPDNALWFTEYYGDRIGRITTSGTITEYAIPTVNATPEGLTVGPDRAIWFTEFGGGKIGRLGP